MPVEPLVEIDPAQFVALVKPPLEAQDLDGLLALLHSHWTPRQIASLLSSPHDDARKVAALALALVANHDCIPSLVQQLKDPDPVVNEMAEYALWSIWFRSGSPEANHELARGAEALNRREFEHACGHFDRAIELDAAFAEPYNQRAIGFYLQERYEESIADCREAIRRMPCHFGAWAGLGHCLAHLGRINEAIDSYTHALAVNPHLSCVREAIETLRRRAR